MSDGIKDRLGLKLTNNLPQRESLSLLRTDVGAAGRTVAPTFPGNRINLPRPTADAAP